MTYVTWVKLSMAKAGRCETWTVLPCTALEVKGFPPAQKRLTALVRTANFPS